MSKTASQIEIYEKISSIALKINSMLGPELWDYAYLFNSAKKNRIEFKSINIKAEELINSYIQEVNSIRRLYDLPDIKGKDLSETFDKAMHNYFELRFLEGRSLFADYELLRIVTDTEYRLMVASKEDLLKLSDSFAIYISEGIVKNMKGDIDIDETIEHEKKNNFIKSYLSCVSEVKEKAYRINIDFREFTTMSVPTYLYNKEIMDMFEYMITKIMDLNVRSIYSYINKGYTLDQAKTNVFTYFRSIIEKQEYRLAPEFSELENDILENTANSLKKLKGLEDRTVEVLKWEMYELLIDKYVLGELNVLNFYDLEFRQADPSRIHESGYDYICDSYLLQNNTRAMDFPIESYAMTLTPRSKFDIFSYVSLGMENPNYRLETVIDYF